MNIEQLNAIQRFEYSSYNYVMEHIVNDWRSGKLKDPPYQRSLVWTDEQKELLIDSILRRLPIGSIFWNDVGRHGYELLDGKQRITAFMDFMDSKFPYNGVYYKDASEYFDGRFSLVIVPTYVVRLDNRESVIELFKRLNYGGTAHTVEDLLRLDTMPTCAQGFSDLEDEKFIDLKKRIMAGRVDEETVERCLLCDINCIVGNSLDRGE